MVSTKHLEWSQGQATARHSREARRGRARQSVIARPRRQRWAEATKPSVALVTKAQAGDRGAFAALAESLYPRLQRMACSIMGDSAAADDATQQAMLDVWRNLSQLRDPARFEAWCFRTLSNACRSEWRRRQRWSRDSSGGPLPEKAGLDALRGVIDREQLKRGLTRLSAEHRSVIVLHHYADMTHEQIAVVLDIPVGTVHSRLHRAMRRLRVALEADARPLGSPS